MAAQQSEAPPRVMMAFACESFTHEPGKPISFNNVLDGIESNDFPAPTGRWFAVFCFFRRGDSTVTNCRVAVAHESGEIIGQTRVRDLKFTDDAPLSRNVVNFEGLSWPYPGWYLITFVAGKDSVLASFPMLVQHAPGAQADEEQADEAQADEAQADEANEDEED